MSDIYVKEISDPKEGDMSLDQFGNVVIFQDGKWVKHGR